MHKLIKISLWILFTSGVIVLLGFTNKKHQETLCSAPNIIITKGETCDFLTEEIILKLLKNKGYNFSKLTLEQVSSNAIEKIIYTLPEVEQAEVYKGLNGTLSINIIEREPILRVFNFKNRSFYIDTHGKTMPLSSYKTANVHVANGNIYESPSTDKFNVLDQTEVGLSKSVLDDLYLITKEIKKDTFLNSQVVQIYLNEQQDIILIPRVGDQKIIVGNAENIQDKFFRLKHFYKHGIKPEELNQYSILNLKYNKQIICSKKINV